MELSTKVEITPLKRKIAYSDTITIFGSCFATSIGEIMSSLRFNVLVNPFGVLYNPASLAFSTERLYSRIPFTQDDIIESDGRFITFHHHSSYSSSKRETLIGSLNNKLDSDSLHYEKSNWVVVTLGTSSIFRHIERDLIVSNCHKIPAGHFNREFLDVDECFGYIERMINSKNPETQWIFTVSPIRHKKDGFHNNQLSKANLLLAVDRINKRYSNTTHYFPAYEIMMDELRDYRFYAQDMLHPSPLAIKIIWEKFIESCIDPDTLEKMKIIEKENKKAAHNDRFS